MKLHLLLALVMWVTIGGIIVNIVELIYLRIFIVGAWRPYPIGSQAGQENLEVKKELFVKDVAKEVIE